MKSALIGGFFWPAFSPNRTKYKHLLCGSGGFLLVSLETDLPQHKCFSSAQIKSALLSPFCFLLCSLFCSAFFPYPSFCSLFCSLLLCPFTYFLGFLVCFSNMLFFFFVFYYFSFSTCYFCSIVILLYRFLIVLCQLPSAFLTFFKLFL